MTEIKKGMKVRIIQEGLLFEDLIKGSIVTVVGVLPDNVIVQGYIGNKYKLELDHFELLNTETPQEYITVPGSDKKFLKPEFEFEILGKKNNFAIGYIVDSAGVIKGSKWYLGSGECVVGANSEDEYNLTPYEQPWYEIESNFPCLIKADDNNISVAYEYQKENGDLWCCFGDSIISAEQAIRLTNEEIDSLKVKEV